MTALVHELPVRPQVPERQLASFDAFELLRELGGRAVGFLFDQVRTEPQPFHSDHFRPAEVVELRPGLPNTRD